MSGLSRVGLAVAAALLLGAIVVFGSDDGEPVRDVRLLSGAAWLTSSKVGQVTLLDGSTVEVAAQVQVAPAGNTLEVAQQGPTGYAVDQTAGTVRRVGGGTFDLSTPQSPIPDATAGLTAIPGGDVVYTVDKRRGMLAHTDPKNLVARGDVVSFAAGTATVDDDGTLWAVDTRTGDLTHVRDGKLNIRRQVAQPGNAEVTMVNGRPVVVDVAGRKAISIDRDTGRPGEPIDLAPRTSDTVHVSGSRHTERLYLVVDRGVLNVCDLVQRDCGKAIALSERDVYGPAVESGDQVFVPDYTTGQVWIIDVPRSRVIAKPAVLSPDIRFELLVRDGVVFYNDTNSERAGVIQLDGKVISASKYDATNPARGLSGTVTPSAPPQQTAQASPPVVPPSRGGPVPTQVAQQTSVGQPPISPGQTGRPPPPSSGSSPPPSGESDPPPSSSSSTPPPVPAEPRLEITMSTTAPTENQTVTLRVNNTTGDAPVSAQWTFGDGGTGAGTTTTHRWTAARPTPYLVTVTATLPDGRQAMTSANVTVSAVPTVRLTVSIAGGGGSVSGGGINCPSACSVGLQPNTQVTLTAQPDATHQLGSWGGACAGSSGASCDVTVDAAKNVTYTFEPRPAPQATLTISSPTGGRVLVGGGGSCPSACSVTRNAGTVVQLTADPDADRVFAGWGGACAGQDATCSVTLTGQQSVSVTFTLIETPRITGLECGSLGRGTFSCQLTATPAQLQIRWVVDGVAVTDENDRKFMTHVCGSDNQASITVTVSNARGSDRRQGGSGCETGS